MNFLLLFSQIVFATWYGTTYKFSVCCYFSDKFETKSVKSVYAHVGVLEKVMTPNGDISWPWYDVKHIELNKFKKGFSKVIEVNGITGGGSGSETVESQGPIVQYWVYLDDGSLTITDSSLVNIVNTPRPVIDETFGIISQIKPYSQNPYPKTPRVCLKSLNE